MEFFGGVFFSHEIPFAVQRSSIQWQNSALNIVLSSSVIFHYLFLSSAAALTFVAVIGVIALFAFIFTFAINTPEENNIKEG